MRRRLHALAQDRQRRVAAAGAPHAGAGERRRAGQVQAASPASRSGSARGSGCAARPADRRRSWSRGRRAGGTRARTDRASSPASRRASRAKPGCDERGELLEPAPRLGAAGPAAVQPVRRVQRLEAEHVPCRCRRHRRVEHGRDVDEHRRAARASRPCAISSWPRSMSASDGAIDRRRRRVAVELGVAEVVQRAQPGQLVDHRVDLRLVAVVVRIARHRSTRSVGLRRRVASATPGTCRAGCTPTRRSAAVTSVPSVSDTPRTASPSHVIAATFVSQRAPCRRRPRTRARCDPAPCRCRRPAGRPCRRAASRTSARRARCRAARAMMPHTIGPAAIAGPCSASVVKNCASRRPRCAGSTAAASPRRAPRLATHLAASVRRATADRWPRRAPSAPPGIAAFSVAPVAVDLGRDACGAIDVERLLDVVVACAHGRAAAPRHVELRRARCRGTAARGRPGRARRSPAWCGT